MAIDTIPTRSSLTRKVLAPLFLIAVLTATVCALVYFAAHPHQASDRRGNETLKQLIEQRRQGQKDPVCLP